LKRGLEDIQEQQFYVSERLHGFFLLLVLVAPVAARG